MHTNKQVFQFPRELCCSDQLPSQFTYVRYNRTDLPAHAYATSAASYWAICQDPGRGRNQVIMVAGASGSGKSFTHSVLVEHLVEVTQMSRSSYFGTTQNSWGIGESTIDRNYDGGATERLRKLVTHRRTILESFGNVGTVSGKGEEDERADYIVVQCNVVEF